MQILLVEDDASLAAGLKSALDREGFSANHVSSGREALTAAKTDRPDIIVLDLGLPDMDGLDVLALLQKLDEPIPVLVLTARDSLDDKIIGLNRGADDYLAKPFDMQELAARLRVFERRLSTANTSTISIGGVELDTSAHSVIVSGAVVEFPRREYMLLKTLMESAGKVLTREALENRLYSWGEEVSSNALEVHIHHLRKKLPGNMIKTVRGIGYTVARP
ncbi:MAG: response regulator transcription factor [Halieaceae bacterium]|jgi:DNA-binding response OmpR family regulator|nr:response regulator transcription factor [Halieaceae bacterium]MBT6123675.1 response regulator transcription factor [Halieaceae bacterium]MBT7720601.1 response regulator transcription factor [Halieaceae bacterium]